MSARGLRDDVVDDERSPGASAEPVNDVVLIPENNQASSVRAASAEDLHCPRDPESIDGAEERAAAVEVEEGGGAGDDVEDAEDGLLNVVEEAEDGVLNVVSDASIDEIHGQPPQERRHVVVDEQLQEQRPEEEEGEVVDGANRGDDPECCDFGRRRHHASFYLNLAFHDRSHVIEDECRVEIELLTAGIQSEPKNAELYVKRGIELANLKDYDSAIRDFSQAILWEPHNSRALNCRGHSFTLKKKFELALKDYIHLLKMNQRIIFCIGFAKKTFRLNWDDYHYCYEAVTAIWTEILSSNPGNFAALYGRGLDWRWKNFPAALRDFTEVIRRCGDATLVQRSLVARVEIYLLMDDLPEAIRDLSEVIRREPHNAGHYGRRADVYFRMEQYDESIQDLNEAIRLESSLTYFWSRATAFFKSGKISLAIQDWASVYMLGDVCIVPKEIGLKIEVLTEVLRRDPRNPTALAKRAKLLAPSKSPRLKSLHAIEDITEAIRLSPDDPKLYQDRGDLWLQKLGELALAVRDYTASLEITPYANVLRKRGLVYYDQREDDHACADFVRVVRGYTGFLSEWRVTRIGPGVISTGPRLEPRFLGLLIRVSSEVLQEEDRVDRVFSILVERGRLYVHFNELSLAIQDFTQAVAVATGDEQKVQALKEGAKAYAKKNEWDLSGQNWSQVISVLGFGDSNALLQRAECMVHTGHEDLALQDYVEALEFGSACELSAAIQAHNSPLPFQVRILTEALRIRPESPHSLLSHRAMVYAKMKQYPLARKDYTTLIQLDPRNSDLCDRAEVCEDAGDLDSAIQDYSAVIRWFPKSCNHNRALAGRARCFLRRGKMRNALDDGHRFVQEQQDLRNEGAYNTRGDAYRTRGLVHHFRRESDDAVKDFERASQLHEFNENVVEVTVAASGLALEFFHQHRFVDSLDQLQVVFLEEKANKDVVLQAHWTAGLVLARTDKTEESSLQLQLAHSPDKSFPWLDLEIQVFPGIAATLRSVLPKMLDCPAKFALTLLLLDEAMKWIPPDSALASPAPASDCRGCAGFEDCWTIMMLPQVLGGFEWSPLFDHSRDRCFCSQCLCSRCEEHTRTRRTNGKRHGVPVGWCEFGLSVSASARVAGCLSGWHMAFHGTTIGRATAILKSGAELLIPGDITTSGKTLLLREEGRIRDPEWANRIFMTKSVAYASKYSRPFMSKRKMYKVMLKVRVKPGSYDEFGATIPQARDGQLDVDFSNDELEWATRRRGAVHVVAILMKRIEYSS